MWHIKYFYVVEFLEISTKKDTTSAKLIYYYCTIFNQQFNFDFDPL